MGLPNYNTPLSSGKRIIKGNAFRWFYFQTFVFLTWQSAKAHASLPGCGLSCDTNVGPGKVGVGLPSYSLALVALTLLALILLESYWYFVAPGWAPRVTWTLVSSFS